MRDTVKSFAQIFLLLLAALITVSNFEAFSCSFDLSTLSSLVFLPMTKSNILSDASGVSVETSFSLLLSYNNCLLS
jgi:hypothetical protein